MYPIKIEELECTFRKPELKDYEKYFSKLADNILETGAAEEFNADTQLIEDCFVDGDKELIDFDNNINLFISYREIIPQMLDIKSTKKIEPIEGSVMGIELIDGDKTLKAYFKMPNRLEMMTMLKFYDAGRIFKADIEYARSCFVDGDKEMILFNEHPNYFVSYKHFLSEIIKIKDYELKKK